MLNNVKENENRAVVLFIIESIPCQQTIKGFVEEKQPIKLQIIIDLCFASSKTKKKTIYQ